MIAPLYIHLAESTVFALAMAAAALCMRRCSAAARYAIWLSGAVKFAVPAALFTHLGASLESQLSPHYSSLVHNATLQGVIYPKFSAPLPDSEYHWLVPVVIVLWLSGLVALFGAWIRRSIGAARNLEDAGAAERSVLAALQQRAGIRRAVRLRYSAPGKCELGVWGIRKPTIRIPRGISSKLTLAEFEAVLLHELGACSPFGTMLPLCLSIRSKKQRDEGGHWTKAHN